MGYTFRESNQNNGSGAQLLIFQPRWDEGARCVGDVSLNEFRIVVVKNGSTVIVENVWVI